MEQQIKFGCAITFALIFFTVTECSPNTKDNTNKSASDLETTTVAKSVDERDKSEEFSLMEVMLKCNDSFRVESSYLESFNQSGSFPDETDKTPKCFMRCVLEKSGVASPASQFDVKRTAEIFPQVRNIPEDEIVKIATECTDRPETCKCERSYQYLKCMMESVVQKYDLEA